MQMDAYAIRSLTFVRNGSDTIAKRRYDHRHVFKHMHVMWVCVCRPMSYTCIDWLRVYSMSVGLQHEIYTYQYPQRMAINIDALRNIDISLMMGWTHTMTRMKRLDR